MRNATLNTVSILNASTELTLRVASPWIGVLWLTALPHRLLQVYFLFQLTILMEPQHYVNYLWRLSGIVFVAFIISLYGRAVFVRACYLAESSTRDTRLAPLKVPINDFVPYVYTALINELFFYLTSFTMVLFPIFIIYSGLAAATSYGIGGPKFVDAPIKAIKAAAPWRSLIALSFVYLFGTVMALINLFVLVEIALALGGDVLGAALPRWEYIFQASGFGLFPKQLLTNLLLMIGATLIIEPFWLAANVDMIQKARARKSGEDLQMWFQDIKSEAAK